MRLKIEYCVEDINNDTETVTELFSVNTYKYSHELEAAVDGVVAKWEADEENGFSIDQSGPDDVYELVILDVIYSDELADSLPFYKQFLAELEHALIPFEVKV